MAEAFGVGAAALPMCDEPVQTYVRTGGEGGVPPGVPDQAEVRAHVEDFEFRGSRART